MRIEGLNAGTVLELRWFDDHKGILLPGAATKPAGVDYMETDMPANVGKSMAFLVQPVGATGDPAFPELPNELIVQIDVNSPAPDGILEWDAEFPIVKRDRDINLTARLKIANPGTYVYLWSEWDWEHREWLLQSNQDDNYASSGITVDINPAPRNGSRWRS